MPHHPTYAALQVLEIGQVGRAGSGTDSNFTFYSHAMKTGGYGDAGEMVQALQQAAVGTEGLQVDPSSP